MNLKPLIKDQVIRIDDHRRGCGEIKSMDIKNDVHIHKMTNFKTRRKHHDLEIKIPINSPKDIQIKLVNSNDKMKDIPSKLNKEIKKALENKEILNAFMHDLKCALTDFGVALSDEKIAEETLVRLTKHFGLCWKNDKIVTAENGELKSYMQQYENKKYYARIDTQKIEIGRNNGKGKRKR